MNDKYKTYEELKEELGDKFEEYMYKANIELLNKIDKAIEYIEEHIVPYCDESLQADFIKILEILGDKENENK